MNRNRQRMDYCLQGEEHAHGHGDHFFESSSPRFFRIILHETIGSRKLSIPKKLARKYCRSDFSGNQPQMVSLKVPSGDSWDVEMEKSDDGQLWLQRGWPEFVDFYGIKHGHFLIFKYKRRGMFHVRVFGTSTTEMKYPIKSSNTNIDEENIHLGEDRSRREMKTQMPNKSSNPQSSCRDDVRTSSTEINIIEIEDTYYEEDEGRSKNKIKPQMSNRHIESRKSRGADSSFSIVMRPTYVHKNFVNVPREIFVGQLGLRSSGIVELRTSDGRSWSSKYSCTVCNGRAYTRLRCGWKKFVKDNNVAQGDLCVFKLINPALSRIIFDVTICKDAANPIKMHVAGKPKKEDRISCSPPRNKKLQPSPASASNCASKFQIVMTQRYLCGSNLAIPSGVAKQMFMSSKETTKNIKLEMGDRTWSVRALYYPKFGIGKMSAGWTNFAKENYLKVGDVCSFEFVDSKKLIMRVCVHHGNLMNGKEEMPS